MNDEIKLAVSQMQAVVILLLNGSTVIGWPNQETQQFKLYDDETLLKSRPFSEVRIPSHALKQNSNLEELWER
ncbi:hypothetical protein E4V51_24440, partial [Paenibacillus sp. 28ISP30-2]|nr:hypothetical protein [Paenibacillus sp. 28ISP30-2]